MIYAPITSYWRIFKALHGYVKCHFVWFVQVVFFFIEAYEIYHTSAHTVLCDSAEAYTDTACPSCNYSSHSPVAESVCVLRETSGRADSVVSLDFYNTSGYYIGR